MSKRSRSTLIFFVAFSAASIALHAPYLKLPYHWDELGQFIPAALDIYQKGAWVPVSTLPNVHPPAVMAYLALVWKIFGYSIPAARIAMLLVASAGVLFAFLLAIRLCRKTPGAPAFAAAVFLLATPMFYTQSMMAQLDMPAMTVTALALLLFLNGRIAWCAGVCALLVLVKETAIATPFVFAAWLWIHDRRRREALLFLAPAAALGAWLLVLHHSTGNWLGNAEFAKYNVADSLSLAHIFGTLERRAYFLFLSDGLWIGAIALFLGRRMLRGRDWNIAFLAVGAQLLVVSIFGGASLDRYATPVYPVLYAAIAAAASVYSRNWRWATQGAMTFALILGWFWNPPYPFSFENNLAMTDFVELQKDAAQYLETTAPQAAIASAWPFTDAISRPEFGYVSRPLRVAAKAEDFRLASLADSNLGEADVLVVFTRIWGLEDRALDFPLFRKYLEANWGYYIQANSDQIRAGLGFVPAVRWTRGGQSIEIYVHER